MKELNTKSQVQTMMPENFGWVWAIVDGVQVVIEVGYYL